MPEAITYAAIIKANNVSDSRRAYQCIKFLVNLANKCSQAKDFLLQNSSRWQWAVNWLKKKMNEHHQSNYLNDDINERERRNKMPDNYPPQNTRWP